MDDHTVSQNELDKLLGLVGSLNDEGIDHMDDRQEQPGSSDLKLHRVFKLSRKKDLKFEFRYISPVIKREDILYNPPPQLVEKSRKKAVYSLDQYRKTRQFPPL